VQRNQGVTVEEEKNLVEVGKNRALADHALE
jgi:hypothetical protein